MTNNQIIHKKLQNMLNELNALIDQSHVFDTKHHKELNDIYTKINMLLEEISIEVICEYVIKRYH